MGLVRRLAAAWIVLALAVSGADASLGATDSSGSSTALAGWGPVVNLSRLARFAPARSQLDDCTPTSCDTTAVAIDDDGNALALWVHPVRGQTVLMSAFRPRTGSWRPPVRVPGSRGASNPVVAFDGAGEAVVAWSTLREVRAVRRTSGGRWPAPVSVFRNNGQGYAIPDDLDVAVNDSGRAVLVWRGRRVRAAVGFPDGRWGRAHILSRTQGQEPDAVVDRWGRATVVWGEWRWIGWFGIGQVMTASRDVGERWTHVRALSRRGGLSGRPWIATQPDGDLAVVWGGRAGDGDGFWLVRKARGRAWVRREPLGLNAAWDLQMVMDAAGVVTVVWAQGGNETLWRVQNRPVRGWGRPVRMTRIHVVTVMDEFPLAGNDAGDVVAAWTFDRLAVQAVRRTRKGDWSTRPATLSEGRGHRRLPAVAVGPEGSAVVIWLHQPPGSRLSRVQARTFAPVR